MSKLKLLVLSPSKDLLQQRLFSCMIRTNCGNPLTPYTYFIPYKPAACKRFLKLILMKNKDAKRAARH